MIVSSNSIGWAQLIDLVMALLCIGLAMAFAALARRHFTAGHGRLGWGMIAATMASTATATVWAVCAILWLEPGFVGPRQPAPCEDCKGKQPVVRHLSSMVERMAPRAATGTTGAGGSGRERLSQQLL